MRNPIKVYREKRALRWRREALIREGWALFDSKRTCRRRGIEIPAEWAARQAAIMQELAR
jgi:hypothetical protein